MLAIAAIPIHNFIMHIDSIDVGRVTIVKSVDLVPDEKMKSTIQKILNKEIDWPLQELITRSFGGRALSIVKILTPTSDLRTDAQKATEDALNVLRFYLCNLSKNSPIYYKMYMGMEGTTFTGLTIAMTIDDREQISTNSSRVGYMYSYQIDAEILAKMQELHLEKINKILQKPSDKLSAFERSFLTALSFYGESLNEYSVRNAFIGMVTALESLLVANEAKAPILAERIALITSKDADKRKTIYENVRRLYEKRNNLIHEGKNDVNEDDLYNVSRVAFRVMVALLEHIDKIVDKPALKKTLSDLKFSAPEFAP